MVSGRQAARILREVLSSDEHGRLLLRTGITGSGMRTSTGRCYDEDAVRGVRSRPRVDERDLARACPRGVFVLRLPRTADLDLSCPWPEVARQVTQTMRRQRPMTSLTAALTCVRIRAWGPLPFAATFLGYVVLAADLTELGEDGPRLEPPGAWAHVVEDRKWRTPPGGRPGFLWTPPCVSSSGRSSGS
jgi:hypothetical protein